MNKFSPYFMWLGLIAVSFVLSACTSDGITTEDETTPNVNSLGEWVAPSPRDMELYSEFIHDNYLYILTDPVTGVQYLVYREKAYNAGMGGITPRLRADGSLYVVDGEGGD